MGLVPRNLGLEDWMYWAPTKPAHTNKPAAKAAVPDFFLQSGHDADGRPE